MNKARNRLRRHRLPGDRHAGNAYVPKFRRGRRDCGPCSWARPSGRERAGGAGLPARPGSVRGRGCRRGRGACGGGVVGAAGERAGAGLSARPGSVRGRGCRRGRGACGGGVVGAAGERAGAGLSARPGSVRGRGCRRGRGACGGGVVLPGSGGAGFAGAGPCPRPLTVRNAPPTSGCTTTRPHSPARTPRMPRASVAYAPDGTEAKLQRGRPVRPAAIRLAVRRRRAAPSLPISDGGLRRNGSLSCQSGGGRGILGCIVGESGVEWGMRMVMHRGTRVAGLLPPSHPGSDFARTHENP